MKILPVIHLKDYDCHIWKENLHTIFDGDLQADGVFFISMDGHDFYAEEVAPKAKQLYPHKLIGLNLLTFGPLEAFRTSKKLGLDMTWADDPMINSIAIADDAMQVFAELGNHMFFASVAFKYQRAEPNPILAALNAASLGMIPTTSGKATGVAANLEKIQSMKAGLGDRPLALASGLDPKNISIYAPLIEYALVSTGISRDFHSFDPDLFKEFVTNSKI
jgi:hypothetical protein